MGHVPQALLFVEELASIVLTPFVLYFSLPACVPAILSFARDFTVHVDGVGDICSLAAFDFARHGNLKYGSPSNAPKVEWARLTPSSPCLNCWSLFSHPSGIGILVPAEAVSERCTSQEGTPMCAPCLACGSASRFVRRCGSAS